MKYLPIIILFIVLPICSPAYSEESEVRYNIHLASYHFNRDYDWNEDNYGFGVEYGGDTYVGAGYYLNSYDRSSLYFVAGNDKTFGNFQIGVFAGLASGYNGKHLYAPLIGGLRVIYENVNILITPSNLGFSLQF